MDITWIVGNGFDLNLGLETGYRYFIDNVYLPTDKVAHPEAKTKLIEAVRGLNGWKAEADKWSDLEVLAGEVTQAYMLENRDVYEDAFLDMELLMRAHLLKEEERGLEIVNRKDVVDEAWKSIVDLKSRLADRYYANLRNFHDQTTPITYNFISLNYTRTFDELLKGASSAHNPFDQRTIRHNGYADKVRNVLHLHGTLDNDGGLVFGVSEASQIKNPDFAEDPEIVEIWTKQSLNHFYGNSRPEVAEKRISETSLFIIYGCSLGVTDKYIWQLVVSRMLSDSNVRLLIFDRGVPRRGGLDKRALQRRSNAIKQTFLSYSELDDSHVSDLCQRIVVESSMLVFDFPLDSEG